MSIGGDFFGCFRLFLNDCAKYLNEMTIHLNEARSWTLLSVLTKITDTCLLSDRQKPSVEFRRGYIYNEIGRAKFISDFLLTHFPVPHSVLVVDKTCGPGTLSRSDAVSAFAFLLAHCLVNTPPEHVWSRVVNSGSSSSLAIKLLF